MAWDKTETAAMTGPAGMSGGSDVGAATVPPAAGPLAHHLAQAEQLGAVAPGEGPLVLARLALACGEADLARALLARSGGLLDASDAARVLAEPVPTELLTAARQALAPAAGPADTAPGLVVAEWSEPQREMYVRVLAGALLLDRQRQQELGQWLGAGEVSDLAGLWRLPALPEQRRWAAGQRLAGAFSGARRPPAAVQWASASWGGRWGLRQELRASASVDAEVVSLEHVTATLSASWAWDLPDLPALLSRPLLIEGFEALSADRQALLTGLMADAAALFGWTVVALPAFEASWSSRYRPLPARVWTVDAGAASDGPTGGMGDASAAARLRTDLTDLTTLAQELRAQGGRNLVVLYSRASAARLCGMLPGSVLLSSSLCRAHLEDKMTRLMERRTDPDLTVIATTLPSTPLGMFDRVYHLLAPLPHLIEAAQLSPAPLLLLRLRDVAVPQTWQRHSELTAQLMAEGDPIHDPEGQRRYAAQLHAVEQGSRLGHWTNLRAEGQYAALGSELNAQSGSAVPVMITYGAGGEEAVQRARAQGWVSRRDLRYAAWATPMEAQRAVRLKQAEIIGSGWAMLWRGVYDDAHGLAWPLIQAERQRVDE